MSIEILLHQVLVQLDEPETKTKSGIILATPEQEKRERKAVEYGTVVKVGPTAFKDYGRNPDILKGGDRISLNRYAGKSVVDSDGTEYVLVNDVDVLCKIN